MDHYIKNIFFLLGAIAVAIFTYAAASYVSSYAKSVNPASFRNFSVSAEGKAVAIPDVAQITVGVTTEGGKDIASLQQENSAKTNRIVAFLKAQAVSDIDLKTTQYTIDPRYEYYTCPTRGPCPSPTIVGYTITQSVRVKIRDFTKIGTILEGVVTEGANSVSQLVFTIDDPTRVENAARAEAIRKAQEKAAGLARSGGFRMGKLISLGEGVGPQPYPYVGFEKAYGMGGGVTAPIVEPGSQEISVTMTLTYEMR